MGKNRDTSRWMPEKETRDKIQFAIMIVGALLAAGAGWNSKLGTSDLAERLTPIREELVRINTSIEKIEAQVDTMKDVVSRLQARKDPCEGKCK